VRAVKDATGDVEGVALLRSQTLSDFFIYSGDDSLTLPMLAVGACGVVSVASHLIGRELTDMIRAYEEGNVAEAREIHLHFLELMRELFMTTNPIPVKAAVARLGLCGEFYRLPLTPLDEAMAARLEGVLREYEFIRRA
jgi:4-hydroxy-tetrahydrodipicolinate synthase